MSMADNNPIRSIRSNDPYRRGDGPSGSGGQAAGSDPLAELARLIGQSDPFADGGQGSRAEPRAPQRPAPSGSADWRKTAAAMPPFEPLQDELQEPRDHYEQPVRLGFLRRDPRPSAAADDPREDPRYDDARYDDGRYDDTRYEADRHQEHYLDDRHVAPARHAQAHYAQADDFEDRRDDQRYASEPHDAHGAAYYDEGAPMGPHDEELYDDPPRARGRNGLITALTLIGCAMIGTAGAYGYRTYYVGSSSTKTPPVITAETTPSKVVSALDSQPTKSFQDRLGEPGQGERVVSREEQPVDLKNPAAAPRIVLPAPIAPSPQQGSGADALARSGGPGTTASIPPLGGTSATPTTAGSEPKRIRTVTIRPDGNDPSGRPVGGLAGSAGQTPSAAAPGRPATTAKSPQRGGAPMSLEPQTDAPAAPPAPRVATAAPATPAPAPAVPATQQLASAPANAGTGGYVVQLSSQRSESEAQASYRSLQAKFPDQLGSRSPIIRRADLGDKGVYYRAMVGPFGSSDEASRFCGSYKAAGGQCIIQKN